MPLRLPLAARFAVLPVALFTALLTALLAGAAHIAPPVVEQLEKSPVEKLSAEKLSTDELLVQKATAARDSWYAYQELIKPAAPAVRDGAWCRNDIDRFILAPIEASGEAAGASAALHPAPQASRETLIRRATYDLTGLPPTPEEVDAFVKDPSTDAYERLVDRLLASPHYGEKWARHWLDLMRYADTNGFERDGDKEAAWKYRDFVVRALNDDMPYARFVRAHVAGDELADRDFDTLVATGFFRLGLWDDEVPDLAQALADDMDSMVDTTARTFLGISMGCCRCHDHKGDPLRQKEYFQFAAYFAGVAPYKDSAFNSIKAENVMRMVRNDFGKADPEAELKSFNARRDATVSEIRALEAQSGRAVRDAYPDAAPADGLVAQLKFEDAKSASAVNSVAGAAAASVRDAGFEAPGIIGKCFHFDGGDDRVELERPVSDDFTISFFFRTTDVGGGSDADRRWFLGKGLVDGEVPGIVRDFGVSYVGNGYVSAGTGDPETFVSSGPGHNDGRWHHVAFTRERASGSIALYIDGAPVDRARGSKARLDTPRKLAIGAMLPGGGAFSGDIDEVRLYDRVLSEETVRAISFGFAPMAEVRADLATRAGEPAAKRFEELHAQLGAMRAPDWKGETVLAVREMSAPREVRVMIRGSPHALGDVVEPGVPVIGGAPVLPPLPDEVLQTSSRPGEVWPLTDKESWTRRSIYIKLKRSLQHPLLTAFDLADLDGACPVRFATVVPTQALSMINGDLTNEEAAQLARRVERDCPGDRRAQIARARALTSGRAPSVVEIDEAIAFLDEIQQKEGLSPEQAMNSLCLVCFNMNEFLYID